MVMWSCGPSDDLEDIPVLRVCYLKGPKGTPAAWPVMYLSRRLVPSAASSSAHCAPVLSPFRPQRFQPWQQLFRGLTRQLGHPDNHDGVITHLEPDVLECEGKWALESICAQAWKPRSQHAGEKRGVAGLLLGRTERAARAAELQLCAQAR